VYRTKGKTISNGSEENTSLSYVLGPITWSIFACISILTPVLESAGKFQSNDIFLKIVGHETSLSSRGRREQGPDFYDVYCSTAVVDLIMSNTENLRFSKLP